MPLLAQVVHVLHGKHTAPQLADATWLRAKFPHAHQCLRSHIILWWCCIGGLNMAVAFGPYYLPC